VLVDRAQQIRHALGYADAPRDEYYSFNVDEDYLDYVERSDRSPDRWRKLRRGRPSPLLFWYRSSPRDLVSESLPKRRNPATPRSRSRA
jgi:hypothetical protein